MLRPDATATPSARATDSPTDLLAFASMTQV